MSESELYAELLTLEDLLKAPAAQRLPPRRHSAPPPAGAGGAGAAAELHSSLGRELSAVNAMFKRWQADVAAKQRAAAAARGFEDDSAFSLALLVMNKRGEVRRGTHTAQGFYFVPRQASQHVGELPCSRCWVHIKRRETYYVDRAARSWQQADEVCRGCMLCLMRSLLGQDEAAILSEAQGILESGWSPTINAALAEVLGGQRRLLAEL